MSILNVNISKFENVRDIDNPINVNLIEWLCDEPDQSVIKTLRTLSGEAYTKYKKQLSGITPSGTFTNRSESGLIAHSGLMQFDIDGKDNAVNMDELKVKIQHIPFVAYCSYSTSGNGLWGLIPIQYPEKHKSHFQAVFKAFQNAGVTIDRAPSNVASFRFTSYDPDPYFNHNAKLFHFLPKSSGENRQIEVRNGRDDRTKVEQLIDKIRHSKIDITDGYDNWLKIGFALADEFGESGREYFHSVSQFHESYDLTEADQQYTNCIKANGGGVSIASFFHICKEYGITLGSSSIYQKDRALQAEFNSNQSAPYGANPHTGEIFDERGYPADWDFHLN